MASILGDTKFYEPAPRNWHGAVPIGDMLYLWGGWTKKFSESSKRKLASVVEIYDPYLETWDQRATTGVPPPGLSSGGYTSLDETLLWYGGGDGKSPFGSLHQLNTVTFNWDELHHNSPSQGPMAKHGCGLVVFQGNKLGLFGGYGLPTGPTQPGSTFIKDNRYSDGNGWTNEFHLFHLQEGVWSSPSTTGSRPPPCASFSFTAIDSHRAVFFGGYNPEHHMMNDVYIFNIQTMHWRKLSTSGGDPWPVGRSGHAACCLNYGKEHPQLLISGGLGNDNKTLNELWVLDVEAGTWKKLMLPKRTQPRHAHTITSFNLSPGVVKATLFGGYTEAIPGGDAQQQPKVAETTVIRLESNEISASSGESPTREWVVKDVAKTRQLGSLERIREKMQELAGERKKARKAERKIAKLNEKVKSAETRARHSLARAVRAEKQCERIPDLEQQLQSGQQLLHAKEEEIKALTTQYRATHDQLVHSQELFSTQQQALSHLQYNAQKKEEQLQAKGHEIAALQEHNQTLANQVVTLQSNVAQLEQSLQATQTALADTRKHLEQQLHSKEAPIRSPTEELTHWLSTSKSATASISTQTNTTPVSVLQQPPVEHAEMQQTITGGTELLLPSNQEIHDRDEQLRSLQADKQELQRQLEINFSQIQAQKERLTTLQAQQQKSEGQIKILETEKQKLQEELTKETFLEITRDYEVDVLRESIIQDIEEADYHRTQPVRQCITSTNVSVHDTHPPTTSPTSGFLRGAEVVAQRDFVITNKAQTYSWEDYGFRLHVPEGSLEAGLTEITVNVRVSLSGHFKLPADSELVSAVYWVFSPHKFSKPLTVEIEHCAAPSQWSDLSFVRTKCTQEKLPYQFKELEGGIFSQKSSYGSISVNHFSGVSIKQRKRTRSESLGDEYCIHVYKLREGLYEYRFIFAVTRNLKACFSVVNQKYCTNQAQYYTSFTLGFEDEQISLDIPSDGIILDSGWEIFPLFQPTVSKGNADKFSSKKKIPHCEIMLRWTKNGKPTVSLKYKIGIHGADKNFFTLFVASESETLSSGPSSPAENATSQKGAGSTDTQTTPQLTDLTAALCSRVADRWDLLGIYLRLPKATLDAIGVAKHDKPENCLVEMLDCWLKTTNPSPTWAAIAEATELLGNRALAEELRSKHCSP